LRQARNKGEGCEGSERAAWCIKEEKEEKPRETRKDERKGKVLIAKWIQEAARNSKKVE